MNNTFLKIKKFFSDTKTKDLIGIFLSLFFIILLMIISIMVVSIPNSDKNKFLKFIAISHWQTTIIVWFVLLSTIILFYYQHKGDDHLIRKAFILVGIGGIIYGLLTGLFSPTQDQIDSGGTWIQETELWLMVWTAVFMVAMILIVPFFIFFTIIRTFITSRENKISAENMMKSFFSIWLMPFIAITVALLLFPLIRLIPEFKIESGDWDFGDFGSALTTLPGIIYSAIPSSISLFLGVGKILAIVVLALFIGIVLATMHKNKYHRQSEAVIVAIVGPHKLISKMIYHVSLLLPVVIATRLPVLFDINTIVNTFESIALFMVVFMIGWFIVLSIEILIIFFTMRNKDYKNFRRFIKDYFFATFIKHAAAVIMEDTIRESKGLGVSDDIAKLTSGISTSMGQSTCGGFYPAMIALMTASMMMQSNGQTLADIDISNIISFIVIMYVVIMITNLGMTGVPGADTAVILSVLSGIGLPFNYFMVVFAVDGIINHIRGIANAFGFVAANNIAERVINTKHRKTIHQDEELFNEEEIKIKEAFDYATELEKKEEEQRMKSKEKHKK